MLLTDTDIKEVLSPSSTGGFQESVNRGNWTDSQNKLLIYPFRDTNGVDAKNDLLTPIGYDLTIGDRYLSFRRKRKILLGPNESLTIAPGETVLILTEEYLGLPKNKSIGGLIHSKVSLVS